MSLSSGALPIPLMAHDTQGGVVRHLNLAEACDKHKCGTSGPLHMAHVTGGPRSEHSLLTGSF